MPATNAGWFPMPTSLPCCLLFSWYCTRPPKLTRRKSDKSLHPFKLRSSKWGPSYLGGLLHDIGIVAELAAMQKEFENAFELARTQGAPLCEAEKAILGLTHGEA